MFPSACFSSPATFGISLLAALLLSPMPTDLPNVSSLAAIYYDLCEGSLILCTRNRYKFPRGKVLIPLVSVNKTGGIVSMNC